jgi:hypothetical protein
MTFDSTSVFLFILAVEIHWVLVRQAALISRYFHRFKAETAFGAGTAASAATDAFSGVENFHECLDGIANFFLLKSQNTFGARLETTAATDADILVNTGDKLGGPDLFISC